MKKKVKDNDGRGDRVYKSVVLGGEAKIKDEIKLR